MIEPRCGQRAVLNGLANGASRLRGMRTVPEPTGRSERVDIGEGRTEAIRSAPELKLTHSGGIDEQRAVRELDQLAMCGRVTTFANRARGGGTLPLAA